MLLIDLVRQKSLDQLEYYQEGETGYHDSHSVGLASVGLGKASICRGLNIARKLGETIYICLFGRILGALQQFCSTVLLSDCTLNVTVTSSIAGIIIPPSHNMIIFALAAGGSVSISKLFLAGVIPGILMCLCLALAAYLFAIKRGYRAENFPGFAALGWAFAGAIPGIFTAVIIVGGVLSGIFTATETGAIGAFYAFLINLIVYRTLTWENFKTTVVSSVRTTSMVLVLIACAGAFAYMLTFYRVPTKTVDLLLGISDNVILILLMINLMLLVLGMIMDMAALILICTPIFLPVMNVLGIDPVQFGIILLVNLGLGLCTLPVGTCLFAGYVVGKLPMEKAIKTIWPFYLAILAALILITFVPAISLTVPNFLLRN